MEFKTLLDLRKYLVNNASEFTDKNINDIDFELLIDERMNEYVKNGKAIILEEKAIDND